MKGGKSHNFEQKKKERKRKIMRIKKKKYLKKPTRVRRAMQMAKAVQIPMNPQLLERRNRETMVAIETKVYKYVEEGF